MKHSILRTLFCLSSLLVIWSGMLSAAPVHKDHIEVELISEVESIQPGQPFWVALRIKTEDHWHTYWQNAGDTGLPTDIKWQLPEGFSAGPIQWPYPNKILVAGMVNYGYEDETLLLTQITPPASLKTGASVDLVAKASWLVCQESCIPGDADLKLALPVADGTPKIAVQWTQAFTNTRAKFPIENSDWKFQAAIQNNTILIRATQPAWFKDQLKHVTLFPEKGPIIQDAEVQKLRRVQNGYVLEIKRSTVSSELPARLQGVLVSSDGWRGAGSEKALRLDVAIEPIAALGNLATVDATQPTSTPSSGGVTLLIAFLSAFIGGLILNLMPCVLPVLSIKILGFVQQAKEEKSKTWQHGAVFTLGVLVSFWVLAGALLVLRAGGEQLGWGFQLQSPSILVIIASLLFLLGLNLFGVFELVVNVGGGNQSGFTGSFMSGALATVVATPCTAPFMGSALGFAIAQPPIVSMLIFTSLGLGMAAPYMILSCAPSLTKFVPKPGLWMETFKQSMGFPMMATVVWLSWVLGIQVGVMGLASLLMAFVVLSIGAWVMGRWGNVMMPSRTRLVAHLIAGVLILGGVSFALSNIKSLAASSPGATQPTTTGDGIKWEPFSAQRVEELRAAGKPVFIDFTAAWCLSCQVNERVALNSPEVQAEFKKLGIVTMKADWTSRDEAITKKLSEFGRSGVPLYVVYGKNPNQPPKVLPEVITPGIVLDGLKTAQ